MTTRTEVNPTELMDQAAQTFFNAIGQGLKLQEEMAGRWVEVFRKNDGGGEWPHMVQQAMKETVPIAQRQADEAMKMLEQSSKHSLDLLSQAFEAGRAESVAEAQMRLEKLWQNSLTALRSNAQTMVQSNARIMEAWAAIAKRNFERVAPTTATATSSGKR